MAERELAGVSPSYEALARQVAEDAALCALLDALPREKRQPNLLFGAVRYLDGPIAAWPEFRGFVAGRWAEVRECVLTHSVQTNEPRRTATLLPLLARLPQPLALLEVGASAGLCLYPDRYRYRYGDHTVGADGPELRCEAVGPVPLPDDRPTVAWRRGLDLHPLDVSDDEDVRWLRALIWPEQTDRTALLDAAVAVARADPPDLRTGDLTRDLASAFDGAPDGATRVVFHTAVLAYVDPPGRDAFRAQLREIGATWIANEAPGVVPETKGVAPRGGRFVISQDAVPVALSAPHGQRLEWLG